MGITNEYREFKKRVIAEKKNFKKHWISVPILVAIISVSSTIIFYEAKPLFSYIKIGYTIADEYLDNGGFAGLEKSEPEVQKDTTEKPDTVLMEEKAFQETTSPVSLIKKYFGSEAEIAIAIAKAESNLNPLALNTKNTNGSVDCGIFQINSIHSPSKIQCEDAEENIKVAYEIYKRSGFKAWSAFNNQSYLKHL